MIVVQNCCKRNWLLFFYDFLYQKGNFDFNGVKMKGKLKGNGRDNLKMWFLKSSSKEPFIV